MSVLMWECCECDEAMDITDWARLQLTGSGSQHRERRHALDSETMETQHKQLRNKMKDGDTVVVVLVFCTINDEGAPEGLLSLLEWYYSITEKLLITFLFGVLD